MLTIWERKTSSNVQALTQRAAFREHVVVSYEELRVTD